MSIETHEQAIDALMGANEADSAPSIQLPEANTSRQESPAPVEQGAPDVSDSNDADLSAEEARLEGLRLADYTRKTQEIAPIRNWMKEANVQDVSQVQQAWDLASQLQSNPVDFYNSLSSRLGELGLLPGSTQPAQQEQDFGSEEYEEIELPPQIKAQLAEVGAIKAQMAQWQQQMEWSALQEQHRAESAKVRELNKFDETDMSFVDAFSYATGGDVEAAANMYHTVAQHILGRQIAAKASVADPPPATRASNAVVPNTGPETLDDAKALALEWLAATEG